MTEGDWEEMYWSANERCLSFMGDIAKLHYQICDLRMAFNEVLEHRNTAINIASEFVPPESDESIQLQELLRSAGLIDDFQRLTTEKDF